MEKAAYIVAEFLTYRELENGDPGDGVHQPIRQDGFYSDHGMQMAVDLANFWKEQNKYGPDTTIAIFEVKKIIKEGDGWDGEA